MSKFSYLIVAALAVAALGDAVDYCALQSCGSKQHTMCKFASSEPSSRCASYQAVPLTAEEKQEILEVHNQLRSEAANPQETFEPLKWDDELAEIAQRWANQCDITLDTCRDVERFQVGQNIAAIAFKDEVKGNLTHLVKMWVRGTITPPQQQGPTLASGYPPRVIVPRGPHKVIPRQPAHVGVPQQIQWVYPQWNGVQWVYPQTNVHWVHPQKGVQWIYPQWNGVQWVYPQWNGVRWVYPQRPGVQWVYPVAAKLPKLSVAVSHSETSSSQLVAGKTTNVGCGVIRYMEHAWYSTYLVCNYGPATN